MGWRHTLGEVIAIGRPTRFIRLVLLSLIAALTEGLGFVLLVPLLASLGGAGFSIGIDLPQIGLEWMLSLFVALVTLRAGAEVLRRLAVQDLRMSVVDGLRMRAADGLLGARWRWLAGLREGEAEALLISDIDRCGFAVEMVGSLVRLALVLAGLLAAALVISPLAAVSGALAGAIAFALFSPVRRQAHHLGKALSLRYDDLHAQISATLRGLRVVKSFGREHDQSRRLEKDVRALRSTERAYVRSAAIAQAVLQVTGALIAAAAIWLALEKLGMPLASVLALAALFVRALPLFGEMQASAQGWAHDSPALDRTLRLIEDTLQHAETLSSGEIPKLTQAMVLENVTVDHAPRRSALAGVSLTIPANKFTAICGPSGAGKSTLADICAGLTAPDSGSVFIDAAKLGEDNRLGWRSRTAYVQQDAVLFPGSVRDNLLFANPAADERQLVSALDSANAQFVHDLPGGLDCDLGNCGRAISGGERQRIALARALLRGPDLIVLDEATSALDAESERAIAQALRALTPSRTIIAVAHRGLLRDMADHVVHLSGGKLVDV